MSSILFLSVTPPTPLPAITTTATDNSGFPFSRRPSFSPLTVRHSSSLISFSSTMEQASPDPQPQSIPDNDVSFSNGGCKGCGKEQVENGCNGEGRIQGGIATVPGFGWWPIKAYRPCTAFLESGGRYKLQGQSMDEVVSGKNDRQISLVNKDSGGAKSSNKKQSPKKLKM